MRDYRGRVRRNFALALCPRRAVLAFAVAAVSACAPATPYVAPSIELSDRYSVVLPVRGAESHATWWTAFRDPSLDRLVEIGLDDGLTIESARQRLRAAEAQSRRAGLSVSGDAALSRSTIDSGEGSQSASLGLALDPAGRLAARIRSAEARLGATAADLEDVRRLFVAQLVDAYIDLRYFERLLRVQRRDLQLARFAQSVAEDRFDNGAATRLDVLAARADVSDAASRLPQTEAAIMGQRFRVTTLAGRVAGQSTLRFRDRPQPIPQNAAATGVPADLLRLRPDIARAERLYAAAVSDIDSARAARYPRLSLDGLISTTLGSGTSSESLAASLTIPVFSQPALAADVDIAKARADEALIVWRQSVLEAVEEVERHLIDLRASHQAIAAARQTVSLQNDRVDLVQELADSGGAATVSEIIDANQDLIQSQVNLAGISRGLAKDYVALWTALARPASDHAPEFAPDRLVSRGDK